MRFLSCALLLAISSGCAIGQSPIAPGLDSSSNAAVAARDVLPEFEVATIKPSDPARCCARTWNRNGREFSTSNTYLQWLIKWAYGLQDKQIVGGPAWINTDRYDVKGVSAGTMSLTDPQWRIAMQKLLADRFHLVFHHETREMSAYVLTVGHGGPKLTKSDPAKDTVPMLGFSGGVGQTMHGYGRDVTLHDFFSDIQRLVLDRPVVDHTGITGTYNFDFAFTREDQTALGMMALPDNAAPNLLTAIDEQLGLKLEGTKAQVDVLVIDGAEQPSAN